MFKPRRPLGRTEFVASLLGIGDVADRSLPLDECVATVRRAMDAGLNVIDTAPSYEAGYSEAIVCKALHGRRDHMFVIDKIDHVTRPVGNQVDASLASLGMDMVDLFVFHGVPTLETWHQIAAPGGGMDQLAECVRAGKCRWRGISSHDPQVLKEAIAGDLCDVVMFAIGPVADPRYTAEILPLARQHGVGTICFKTFGAGKLLGDTPGYGKPLAPRLRTKASPAAGKAVPARLPHLSVTECLHYTLTWDPDVALLGMSFPAEQDAAFKAATTFTPLSADQLADIRARAAVAVQHKGPCWWNPQA